MEDRTSRTCTWKHRRYEGAQMSEKDQAPAVEVPSIAKLLEVDTSKLGSAVLARLIEEVRNEKRPATPVYDRVHNRHNRGR